ncbi:S8 family serine peptidase [Longimicrobium sp.]|uniref:S8 family serine peptidase n=1 Tax=Longimicrobium sp. TaxID=2029185 RepID=UPI003B3B3B8B
MQTRFRPLGRSALAAPMVAVPLLLGACDDRPLPIEPAGELASVAGVAPSTVRTAGGDLVTGDAAAFAQALAEIGPEGEVLVWLKEAGTPGPSPEFLINLPGSGAETIALPAETPGAKRRNNLGPASIRGASVQAVVRALGEAGVDDPRPMQALPVMSVRLREPVRLAALRVLLRHPNVDYVSAVRSQAIEFTGLPTGLNAEDTRHTVHDVLSAWDITRGSGVKIGIMDSGLARVAATGNFHEDALFTTSTFGNYGVVGMGFVDDECGSTPASTGSCIPYDDRGHGSIMAGLAGANDNDLGSVGIAPFATTYSMKISWNTYIRGYCGSYPWDESTSCLEGDDFIRAIDYAAINRFHVLSMSFWLQKTNSDDYRALSTAYNTYGVFLVAATGNTVGGAAQYPAAYDVVMGVGGVDAAGNNLYSTAARDVSGYYFGRSLNPTCYKTSYCDAGSPGLYGNFTGSSIATATVAGVVGLVRAAHPTETPAQIWQRITATAEGTNKVVKANAAINWVRP